MTAGKPSTTIIGAIIVCTALGATSPAYAKGGPAVPLRLAVQEAPLIVVARVERMDGTYCWIHHVANGACRCPVEPDSTTDAEGTREEWPCLGEEPVAVLCVEETLKGKAAPGERLRVPFAANIICPAPPRYVIGDTVLALLRKEEEAPEMWRTMYGRSCGMRVLADDGARAAYTARVREIQQIIEMKDAESRRGAIIEWLVKCVENPATRGDGMYELEELPYPRSHSREWRVDATLDDLSQQQRRRLRRAFVETKPGDRGNWTFCRLTMSIVKPPDVPVAERLLAELRKLAADDDGQGGYLPMRTSMAGVIQALDWQEGRQLYEKSSIIPERIRELILPPTERSARARRDHAKRFCEAASKKIDEMRKEAKPP